MNVTEIKLFKAPESAGSILGNGTVTFDGLLNIKITIMKTKEGKLFVNWPSRKGKDDKYYSDVYFTVNEDAENPYEFKNAVDEAIVKEFNKVIGIASTPKAAEPTKETPGKTVIKKSIVKFKD